MLKTARHDRLRPARRALLGLVMAVALWASVGPASAAADTLSMSLSSATPTDGVPMTVTLAANSTAIDTSGAGPFLYVVVQPSSAGGCGVTYGDDTQVVGSQATTISGDSFNNSTQVSTGQTSTSFSYTGYSPGAYTLCAWLESTSNDYSNQGYTASVVTATASGAVTFVNTDTVATTPPTASPTPKVPFTVTFSGQADAVDSNGNGPYLYAVIQPSSSGSCGATYGDDVQVVGSQATTITGDSYGNSYTQVNTGAYSDAVSITETKGTYVICTWLESTGQDQSGSGLTSSVVLAAASPATYTVGAPPASPPASAGVKPKPTLVQTLRARLHGTLTHLAATARQRHLALRSACDAVVFHAPAAGRLTIRYYQLRRHAGNLLVCSGSTKFVRAGEGSLAIDVVPTAYARRLVRRGRSFKAVIYARFQPRHGRAVVLRRTVRLS